MLNKIITLLFAATLISNNFNIACTGTRVTTTCVNHLLNWQQIK